MPDEDVAVDLGGRRRRARSTSIVRAGIAVRRAPRTRTAVHVDVDGLEPTPGTTTASGSASGRAPSGAPAPPRPTTSAPDGAPLRVRVVPGLRGRLLQRVPRHGRRPTSTSCCSSATTSTSTARRRSAACGSHSSPEVTDLAGYRNRYALYKSDPNLQAAARRTARGSSSGTTTRSRTTTPDDRSQDAAVDADDVPRAPGRGLPGVVGAHAGAPGSARRARTSRSTGGSGTARSPRSSCSTPASTGREQACDVAGISLEPACDEVRDPDRTLVGGDAGTMARATDCTDVDVDLEHHRQPGGDEPARRSATAILNYDQWDGYAASRQQIFDVLGRRGHHQHRRRHRRHPPGRRRRPRARRAARCSPPSSSAPRSPRPRGTSRPGIGSLVTDNLPRVKYFNADQRGWCHNVVTPDGWTAEFRVIEDNRVDGSPATVDATFTISPDRPGSGARLTGGDQEVRSA